MSAGWRLVDAGYKRFKLLELEDQVGGNARSGRNAVICKLARLHLTRGPARAEPRPTKAARERSRKSIPRL